MDDSDGAISFDAEGHCNHCRDFLRRLASSRRRLDDGADVAAPVARIHHTKEGAPYDCVIGISGGCDSTRKARRRSGTQSVTLSRARPVENTPIRTAPTPLPSSVPRNG